MAITINNSGVKFSDDSIQLAAGLGYNQTWQNVTGSRSIGTTYQNTTGQPILVTVCVTNNSSGDSMQYIQVSTDGANWVSTCVDPTASQENGHSMSSIVPNNSYYRVYREGPNTAGLRLWSELR